MNDDATPPTAYTAVKTCHSTTRLLVNASWTSDRTCGGSVEKSGMKAYSVGTAVPVPCGMDWINDGGRVLESSFRRTALPIVTPQTCINIIPWVHERCVGDAHTGKRTEEPHPRERGRVLGDRQRCLDRVYGRCRQCPKRR